jgi:hypothetical protein
MSEENNTPVEETLDQRAQRKLADAESALFAAPEKTNNGAINLDGAILKEV